MTHSIADPVGTRLRRIQRALGVQADGLLGPETLSALETRLDIATASRATSLQCSRASLDEIVRFEVSSQAYYEKTLQRPTWPGAQSGVTIGIGYDIGMTPRRQIDADWRGEIADADLEALQEAQGVKGEAAKRLAQQLSQVSIPFDVAARVFYRSTLPRFAKLTRGTYPGVHALPADAQGMLLSLVYNRGASLSGPARAEMATIKPLVKGGVANLTAIAEQFEQMVRLWPALSGLQKRRQREAALIRAADRVYADDELIRV